MSNRPFLYDSSWGLLADAQLSGTFDLVFDEQAGTAQLTNLDTRIVNPVYAPPRQDIPLTASTRAWLDNIPLATRWPTDLSSLAGRFLAPDLIEFDGPSNGIYFVQPANSSRPTFGYGPGFHYVEGFSTVLQVKLEDDTATLSGVATMLLWNDAPFYYLLNARATLVPEPGLGAMLWILTGVCYMRRRKATLHNRV
jgi:hypothetical protein